MRDGPRLLVAAALAKIIEPLLRQSLSDATVRIAEDKAAVERAVGERLRFDVVVSDLTWNDYVIEYSFDGLDVLDILRRAGRQTPVIFAAQGHGVERDHLDEAVEQPEVVGIYRKATGPRPLIEASISRFEAAIFRSLRSLRGAALRISHGSMPISGKGKGRPPRGWLGRSPPAGPSTTKRSPAQHMWGTTPPRSWSTT